MIDDSWTYDKRSIKSLQNFKTVVQQRYNVNSSNINHFRKIFPQENDVILIEDESDIMSIHNTDKIESVSYIPDVTTELTKIETSPIDSNEDKEAEIAAETIAEIIDDDTLDDDYVNKIFECSMFRLICIKLTAILSVAALYKLTIYFCDKLKEKSLENINIYLSSFILPYIKIHGRSRLLDNTIDHIIKRHPLELLEYVALPLMYIDQPIEILSFIVSKLNIDHKNLLLNLFLKNFKGSVGEWIFPIITLLVSNNRGNEVNVKQLINFLDVVSKRFNNKTFYGNLISQVVQKIKSIDPITLVILKRIVFENKSLFKNMSMKHLESKL